MSEPVTDSIHESTTLRAPIGRCFLLSTRVELVKMTLGMELVDDPAPGYVTEGHIVADSRVHWRGWKFGLLTHHYTLITGFAAPHAEDQTNADGDTVAWFQDSQAKGRFAFFQHDHYFRERTDEGGQPVTVLEDKVRFALPFGVLGRMAAKLLLGPHIRRLVQQRYETLRVLAEGEGWREFVEP